LEEGGKERQEGVSREDSSFKMTSTPRPRAAAMTDVAFPASIPTAVFFVDIKGGGDGKVGGPNDELTILQYEGERRVLDW
jgi:hypothetical protein